MPIGIQTHIYRFGVFEADTRSGELRKNGVKLKIQTQPFEVLIALLERPNDLVTRDELRQRLWPSDTFVDFDHGLNTAINKLRDLLGDTASNPRFIETLPKRGYRFVAPLHVQDTATTVSTGGSLSDANRAATGSASESQPLCASTALASARELPELPRINRTLGRSLILLIQVMYICFYVAALWKLTAGAVGDWRLFMAIIVSAVIAIPLRLYLLTAAAFDYPRLDHNFRKLWPAVFFFDLLWALSPFLLLREIGFGLAFGACAALLYVPFSQRTLIRMTYPPAA
jgi:DNA-binding winged helix-turn-helix (wHTH) protein